MGRSAYNIQRGVAIDKHYRLFYDQRMKLTDAVVLVTGSSDRMGRDIAMKIASFSASVVVHYHTDSAGAEHTASCIKEQGGIAITVQADLRTRAGVSHLIDTTIDRFGRWDALVNCASVFETVAIEEVDEQQWENDHALHARAPFFLSRALYLHRKAGEHDGPACVVNITDTQVRNPTASRPSYYSAKAALEDQVRILGRTLAPYVRVNAVAPGAIIPASASDEAYFGRLRGQLPFGELAKVEDVSDTVIFLLSNDSITGQTIVVDGGEHLL